MKSRKEFDKSSFVPSTGDEDYLNPAGSLEPIGPGKGWTGRLSALSLSTLDALATDIGREIDKTHKAVARAQIKVGKLLLEARKEFPGDKEFGQWRKEMTPIKSRGTAFSLMRVAETFKDAPELVAACSFSVLRELVYCPKEVREGVEESVKQGIAPPSVLQTIAMKKSSAPRGAGGTNKKNMTIYDREERDPDVEAMKLVQSELLPRLNHKDNYVKLGLYPFGGPPNPYVIDAIEHWWEEVNSKDPGECTDEQLNMIYKACHEIHKEIAKGLHP